MFRATCVPRAVRIFDIKELLIGPCISFSDDRLWCSKFFSSNDGISITKMCGRSSSGNPLMRARTLRSKVRAPSTLILTVPPTPPSGPFVNISEFLGTSRCSPICWCPFPRGSYSKVETHPSSSSRDLAFISAISICLLVYSQDKVGIREFTSYPEYQVSA